MFILLKGSSHLTQKDIKTQLNRLSRKQSVEEIIELKNDDSRDWWTKYFASVESAIIEVCTQKLVKKVHCQFKQLILILGKPKNSIWRH